MVMMLVEDERRCSAAKESPMVPAPIRVMFSRGEARLWFGERYSRGGGCNGGVAS
jgi:hypothetical protein